MHIFFIFLKLAPFYTAGFRRAILGKKSAAYTCIFTVKLLLRLIFVVLNKIKALSPYDLREVKVFLQWGYKQQICLFFPYCLLKGFILEQIVIFLNY